jgi:UV DNA damage endonuclease
MNIGYACLAVGVSNTQIKGCTIANASDLRILELAAQNLESVGRMLDYNGQMDIRLFRISSDIIPFAGNPVNTLNWPELLAPQLAALGDKARSLGIRISMHPGQYTVLNSPRKDVVEAAIRDLAYHTTFMDAMGLGREHKIILHVGGGYGNHREAMKQFALHAEYLTPSIRNRLVLENDERIFSIDEVLELSEIVNLPVVFDILHHQANPNSPGGSTETWIAAAGNTWGPQDGPPKLHYSQQDNGKKTGAHSATISLDGFFDFIDMVMPYNPDIMLEVKDKNLSAVKCINALADDKKIGRLEQEWSRYKYNVLEHAPNGYNQIRQLLKEKTAYPVKDFYGIIEASLGTPATVGNAKNAAAHVWGYYKTQVEPSEKARFERLLTGFGNANNAGTSMKSFLLKLQEKYEDEYLKKSLYFYLP